VSELCGQTKPKIIIMMEQMKKKKLKGLNKTFLFCDKAERKKKKSAKAMVKFFLSFFFTFIHFSIP
jgi:hypothetical protein